MSPPGFLEKISFHLLIFWAHLSFGKPNIPELIAGIEILSNPFRKQSSRQLLMALLNFSFSLPSPILGPTVCMLDLHGKIPLDVIVDDPT